jgi:hypothetical protein
MSSKVADTVQASQFEPLRSSLKCVWLQKPHYYTKAAGILAKKRNKIVYAFFKQLEREIALTDF